ncbi:MAG: hypothetical protein KAG97_13140, partial [Victivallales bacterium]|nr:hypothetical protein [Victivallales bacterium]
NGHKIGSHESDPTVLENAKPDDRIVLGVHVTSGTWSGIYYGAKIYFSIFDDIVTRTRSYLESVSAAEELIPFSDEKERWTQVLNASASLVDINALMNYDEDTYFKSLVEATSALDALEPLFKKYSHYMVSYSHIDLAWLWDYDEGEDVTRDTLKTVFELLREYPEWIYTHSQSHSVKWIEDDYPEIFSELKEWYEKGRIELLGGTWSEHDSNLPSGEGFVRQFLYGKRYFRDKFGKDIIVGWTPDSFGYNWNLPQILVKSGMKGFVTQKLGSNEETKFPHRIFWWKGVDGSRILTYFPPGGYADSVNKSDMISRLAAIKSLHGVDESFVVFGVGDHGGGLTRGHLDRAFSMKNDKTSPNIIFTSAEDYFAHLRELAKTIEFPTWDDELYLEHHRGTYTTQAETKKNNRRCEQLLIDVEKLATISTTNFGTDYPGERLFNPGWYYVLLNHMHDILPGSSIRKVYEDADRDYAKVREAAGSIIGDAMTTLSENIDTT